MVKKYKNIIGEEASLEYIAKQKVTAVTIKFRVLEDSIESTLFSKLFKGKPPKVIKEKGLVIKTNKRLALTLDRRTQITTIYFFDSETYERLCLYDNVHAHDIVVQNKSTKDYKQYCVSLSISSIININWERDHRSLC